MPTIAEQLGLLEARSEKRELKLVTLRSGPIDLGGIANHIQGITRTDRGSRATLVISVAGDKHGELWLADFDLVRDPERAGCSRIDSEGQVVKALSMQLPHPGGLQASGDLLAVASEAGTGWARIEIFDIARSTQPRLIDTLVLDSSLKEGVAQQTGSKAGWLSFAELGPDEYVLFVGGRSFAQHEGWFYRYLPRAEVRWIFEGSFSGQPVSSNPSPWGPQNGGAFVGARAGSAPQLVTFGAKGTEGGDSFTPRLRCFSLERTPQHPYRLRHEPSAAPLTYSFRNAGLAKLFGPNARWGSTAFVDAGGDLLAYFTARNPRPREVDHVHELEIFEFRHRSG